ncbi:MAG: hypothetical protein RLZZ453_644 [Chlamydiota bacterium]|jgi:hypothetical protein
MSTPCSVCSRNLPDSKPCCSAQVNGSVRFISACSTCQQKVNLAAFGIFQSMTSTTKQDEYNALVKKTAGTIMPHDPLVATALLTSQVRNHVMKKRRGAPQ